MLIKQKLILITKISLFVILLIGLYQFFWGRFNFINPWVIGLDKTETNRCLIYYHKNGTNISCLSKIDSLIVNVEKSHKLQFKGKVEIVISANIKEHIRYTGNVGPFVTYPVFGRIYLPYTDEYFINKTIPLTTYIKHELSHSIIYHNISFSKLFKYPLWFMEGLATYSSCMMGIEGYPKKDTVENRIVRGYFINPNDWGKMGFPFKGLSVQKYPYLDAYWFAYSEFGYIIDDLSKKYGEQKLIEFLHLTLKEKRFDDAFITVYKLKFNNYIQNYLNNLNITNKSPNCNNSGPNGKI